jgi:hypothetical protein
LDRYGDILSLNRYFLEKRYNDCYWEFGNSNERIGTALNILANTELLGIKFEILSKYNIHLHVPEGATQKMGHAGIAMLIPISFLYTKESEENMAMTGKKLH